MTIKHLVFGGGGAGGYAIYGAMKHLEQNKFWSIDNIQTIYATSIGTLIAIYIALKYEWNIIDDYLIKRPWDKVISIKPMDVINIWHEKGVLNEDVIKLILKPLLEAKELNEDITLKEFYDYNSIELHFYTTNLNEVLPTKIDISYKTHPDIKLYKAAAMSAAIPIIFSPIYDNSGCYIDGGLLNNFPLDDCINETENIEEILAIRILSNYTNDYMTSETILPSYLYNLIEGMRKLISTENSQHVIPNIITCNLETNSFSNWMDALASGEKRKEIINIGEIYGKKFLDKL
tara:strand:- start:1924 stop:2793 length:870 start_codon:yes stop_codon:yes gene_type:complete